MPQSLWTKIAIEQTLIICEKPSVAKELALVLSQNQNSNYKKNAHSYTLPPQLTITWAYGHLLELFEPGDYTKSGKNWEKWSLETLPIIPGSKLEDFKLKVKNSSNQSAKDQLNFICKELKNTKNIIGATDAGREGELIFRNLLEFNKIQNPNIFRLWISSLTKESITKGFSNLFSFHEFDPLHKAAKCRSIADWLVGLNGTRLLTLTFRGINSLWSVGRVQTPTLALIAKRDRERINFISKKYFELRSLYKKTIFKHSNQYKENEEALAKNDYAFLKDQPLEIIDLQYKTEKIYAPRPFDLNQLQQAGYQLINLSAQETLNIAQSLYEKKLITYPRTDSQYLTTDMRKTLPGIIENLKKYSPMLIDPLDFSITDKRFDSLFKDEKVTDHHAIIPTGLNPNDYNLSSQEKILFEAILRRFLALFYPYCEKSVTKVIAMIADKEFITTGTIITKAGFLKLYPKKLENQQTLPDFMIHEIGPQELSIKDLQTNPPSALNDASLLAMMENADKEKGLGKLGTSATRASIIETLIGRKYIERKEKTLVCTELGFQLLKLIALEEMRSASLTGVWEEKLQLMEKNEYSHSQFMQEVISWVKEFPNTLALNTKLGLGPCPNTQIQCTGYIIKGNSAFGCSQWKNTDHLCNQRFPFEMFMENTKISITDKIMHELLIIGKSNQLKLKNGQIEFNPENIASTQANTNINNKEKIPRAESIGECYVCKSPLNENTKAYVCSQWRNGCTFTVWKKMAKKTIPRAQIRKLLKTGTTDIIEGFTSAKNNKFSAKVYWAENEKKISFQF